MRTENYIKNPTTPGEILSEEFLKPLDITQKKFADHIKVDIKTVNRVVNGRTSITPDLALKFAAALDTTPDFWLNLQYSVDISKLRAQKMKLPKSILKQTA
jgi:addiction module HigA family antidote